MEQKKRSRTSNESFKKYHDRAYKRYTIMLRYDTDSDLIDLIDRYMVNGHSSPTQAIKAIMRGE